MNFTEVFFMVSEFRHEWAHMASLCSNFVCFMSSMYKEL